MIGTETESMIKHDMGGDYILHEAINKSSKNDTQPTRNKQQNTYSGGGPMISKAAFYAIVALIVFVLFVLFVVWVELQR